MNIKIFGALCFLSTTVIAQKDLVLAAKERLNHTVFYDGAYQSNLQLLVHEDMLKHFDQYPQIWGLSKPDSNIDHRRVPNLEVFFGKYGQSLPITQDAQDYQPGDIVSWRLTNNRPHIGIVSDVKVDGTNRYQIIHNIGWGPQQEDVLFDYTIVGHFRY